MKGVMILLSLLAAAFAAPSPDPQYTISWNQGVDGGYGTIDGRQNREHSQGSRGWSGGDGRREDNGRRAADGRRVADDGRRVADDGRRGADDGRYGVIRGSVSAPEDFRRDDSKFPYIIGRQGLGYQKRNFRSLAMRFPITPEILQPIGYRNTLDELQYVSLNRYN